mmetsp:Transcript_31577/g.58191  ORF Transcript_31577/g.58191 Transcript_31577/m.58191 type:complete len:130 (+) Transcript_31577:585-974(+)
MKEPSPPHNVGRQRVAGAAGSKADRSGYTMNMKMLAKKNIQASLKSGSITTTSFLCRKVGTSAVDPNGFHPPEGPMGVAAERAVLDGALVSWDWTEKADVEDNTDAATAREDNKDDFIIILPSSLDLNV